ncbi:hypothetical protein TNCV_4041661 [Trichonephila clavipes]|nr:hypothetical protein TNCV_4041661 [Trichonephila clavipes]
MAESTQVLEDYNQRYQEANKFLVYEDRQDTRLLPVASDRTGSAINHRQHSSNPSERIDDHVSRYPRNKLRGP